MFSHSQKENFEKKEKMSADFRQTFAIGGTWLLHCMFWFDFSAFLSSVLFSFHVMSSTSSQLHGFNFFFYVGLIGSLYFLPSLLGPNSCKIVKFISAACQKYKNTASFLFSCIYLILSAHPIFNNEGKRSRHAMALCAATTSAIDWVKLSGSSLKASLIFALWFVPASLLASVFLFHTNDVIIFWPTIVAVITPFVPVDYKVLFRFRLVFNKPPPPISSRRRRNDIEMPPERDAKAHCVKDDMKIESKHPQGSVREGKKDDHKKTDAECKHGPVGAGEMV